MTYVPLLDLYDPGSGRFNAHLLELELTRRALTPDQFAERAHIARSTLYCALAETGVRRRTALKILVALRDIEPVFAAAQ
jgi:predicted transcriptional regulator